MRRSWPGKFLASCGLGRRFFHPLVLGLVLAGIGLVVGIGVLLAAGSSYLLPKCGGFGGRLDRALNAILPAVCSLDSAAGIDVVGVEGQKSLSLTVPEEVVEIGEAGSSRGLRE